ncbi:MAG: hypothetical protein HUJ66_01625 [Oscillospiraceae bacterium]|nr:hypothetical protein [Oscillospiraceae bacterium]
METGSEFWGLPLSEKENSFFPGGLRYTLSGRTALDMIAADLRAERNAESIYMPAYCCDSMLEPFKRRGFKIRLYGVEPFPRELHRRVFSDHGCDAILLLDYFGFASEETAVLARAEKLRGTAVILDCVQSAFSQTEAVKYADYSVYSFRKFFFSCAGAAKKHCGAWCVPEANRQNGEYISGRRRAAELKAAYIEKGEGEKSGFLRLFGEAEELLDEDFEGYAAEEKSLEELRYADTELIVSRRRENAALLLKELRRLPAELIRPLYAEIGETDVPLFMPVLVKKELRQPLRQHLINNGVYCPVHWPSELGGADRLYDGELSLVCDQRYGAEAMRREMTLIREFLEDNGYIL